MGVDKRILAAFLVPTFIILYIGGSTKNVMLSAIGIFLLIVNAFFNIKKRTKKKTSKTM